MALQQGRSSAGGALSLSSLRPLTGGGRMQCHASHNASGFPVLNHAYVLATMSTKQMLSCTHLVLYVMLLCCRLVAAASEIRRWPRHASSTRSDVFGAAAGAALTWRMLSEQGCKMLAPCCAVSTPFQVGASMAAHPWLRKDAPASAMRPGQ